MTPHTLILGAGPAAVKKPGFVNLDVRKFAGIDVVHDLNVRPWPFSDGSFVHINATHVVEHLNDFPATMDECHRVLAMGGSLFLEIPIVTAWNLDLAFADPTHRAFFRLHSLLNYITLPAIVAPSGNESRYCKHAWCPGYITPAWEAEKTGILRALLFPIPDAELKNKHLMYLHEIG